MKLYKYYRPAEYAFKSLKDQTVCFNSMANFTDPMEGRYKMISEPEPANNEIERIANNATHSLADRIGNDYTDLIRFKFRVLSVTDDCSYSYMWKEYAENGAGFCVEYDSDDLEKCSDAGARMNYTDVKDPNGVFQNPDGFYSLRFVIVKTISDLNMKFVMY